MTRRQLRESIFKALFRIEFNGQQEWAEQLEYHLQELMERSVTEEAATPVNEEDIEYIRKKTQDIYDHTAELDAEIEQHTEGWSIGRIGKAELAILRLAVYEMNFDPDVPQGVAINEAVELTKRYCDEEAGGFVNAVLGKLAKEV